MKLWSKIKILLLFLLLFGFCILPFAGAYIHTAYLESKINRLSTDPDTEEDQNTFPIAYQLKIVASSTGDNSAGTVQLQEKEQSLKPEQLYAPVIEQLNLMAEKGAVPKYQYGNKAVYTSNGKMLYFVSGSEAHPLVVRDLTLDYGTLTVSLLYNTENNIIYDIYMSGAEMKELMSSFQADRSYLEFLDYLGISEKYISAPQGEGKHVVSYDDGSVQLGIFFSYSSESLNYWVEN